MILTNAERNEDLDTSHFLVNNMEPQSVENSSSVILPIDPLIPDLCPQSGTIFPPLISPICPDSSPNAPPLIFDKGVSGHDNLENQEVILHMFGLHESDSEDSMSSSLPTEKILLKNFEDWSLSMDGGCQIPEIAYRSKLIMKNMVRSIGIQSIMKPKTVCQYYTGNDRITAATTNVYLRYLTSFLLFLHEEYPKIFRFEDPQLMKSRISR